MPKPIRRGDLVRLAIRAQKHGQDALALRLFHLAGGMDSSPSGAPPSWLDAFKLGMRPAAPVPDEIEVAIRLFRPPGREPSESSGG